MTTDKQEAALQAISDFGQWQEATEHLVRRIAELEQALDKAIRALESGLVIPTSEIAKLREVRRD